MMRFLGILLILSLLFPATFFAKNTDTSCMLAKELAKKSIKLFEKDREKGLSGLIQANKFCPEDFKIAYNLGAAYYQYKRPDLAYDVWSKLAEKHPNNFKLLSNLAYLSLKLGRLEDALDWCNKSLTIRENKDIVSLKVEILFKMGEYKKALDFAIKHNLKDMAEKAGEYLAETIWNRFREGEKEEALKEIVLATQKYPSIRSLSSAKDKMVLAMIDETQIPLPKPLPDIQFKQRMAQAPVIIKKEDEVLDLASLKQTLKPRKSYALIVGIRKYKHLKGPRYADNDAINMYKILVKRCGFKDDDSHIRVRINSDATLGTLYNDIEWLARKAALNPDAIILFYFSGHGAPLVEGNNIKDGLLVPYDAGLDNLNTQTAIALSYLKERFRRIKNQNVIFIFDACFTGTGKSVIGMKLVRPSINVSFLKSNKLFISASAANRPAKEYIPGRQGAFTYFFIKALIGEGDQNKDGWVDTMEAFLYAKEKLQALEYDQNPQISIPLRIKLARVK
ncbi:MAG: caspase family protein [Thermodesulfobacterium sp.]|nr:caspase family protein [Thermodesulfobacterium sp.]